jgi:hypothetical protein
MSTKTKTPQNPQKYIFHKEVIKPIIISESVGKLFSNWPELKGKIIVESLDDGLTLDEVYENERKPKMSSVVKAFNDFIEKCKQIDEVNRLHNMVGEIITVDGPAIGYVYRSFIGDLFKVHSLEGGQLMVERMGTFSNDGKSFRPNWSYLRAPHIFSMDPSRHSIRVVSAEEVMEKMEPCVRTLEDENLIWLKAHGYQMTNPNVFTRKV